MTEQTPAGRIHTSRAQDEGASCAVLIVESNLWFREFLQRALRGRFPALEVSVAEGVREALPLAEQTRPRLMLVDVHLGDGRGFDLIHGLRGRFVDATVALLSTFDLPEYRDEAERCGADYFLGKCSFRLEDLAALVRAATAAGRAS